MISIIVPVYNVEKYLRQCVESIKAQAFHDWELILVDDGSTDSSGLICDSFAKTDSRIRVIHLSNCGPAEARNRGISASSGSFLAFIDSDDMVSPHYLQVLLEMMEQAKAGISSVAFSRFLDKPDKETGFPDIRHARVASGEKALERILYQTGTINNSVWGKLFSRDLWENIAFKPGILYEDLEVTCRIFPKCDRVVHLDVPLYYYRDTPGSALSTLSVHRRDVITVAENMVEQFRETPVLYRAAGDRLLSAAFNMIGLMAAYPGVWEGDFKARCERHIEELYHDSLLNPRVRVKNKAGILLYKFLGRKIFNLVAARIYK